MRTVLFVRHAQTDYNNADARGLTGFRRSLVPLNQAGIEQAERTAQDPKLARANLILSSPYTNALQTAAIISRVTGIALTVAFDLHEWLNDSTGQWASGADTVQAYEGFLEHHGRHPPDKTCTWEELEPMRTRFGQVLEQYAHFETLIVVSHSVVITSFLDIPHQQAPAHGHFLEWRVPT